MNFLNIELESIDENGYEKIIKLQDFKGKTIILYFYPQDDTPVCTQEANKFNDVIEKLNKDIKVIGVSANDIDEHKEFKEKYKLKFMLISDKYNELKESILENIKPIQNIKRSTFILNKNGEIVKYWEKVDIENHIEDIINYLKNK